MRTTFPSIIRIVIASILLLNGLSLAAAAHQEKQDKAQKLSDAERKEAQKIQQAADTASKMQAIADFIQKYPQSSLRPAIVNEAVRVITATQDMAQRVTYSEKFLSIFNNANETAVIYPVLIGGYVFSNRSDDAFNAGAKLLQTTPDEAYVLYLLTLSGANEAQRGNKKFLEQSTQYSQKAIQLFEANSRPASVSEEEWSANKNQWLSQLYQSAALIALVNNKNAEAQANLQKAAALTPYEPMIYYVLGGAKNDEYQALASQFRTAPAGPAKDEARKKAEAKLDEVIEMYARVMALTEGKEQFKAMRDQTLIDLTTYYKYRHNDSTAGLQELINKYKQPTTP